MLTAKVAATTLMQIMRGFPPIQIFLLGLAFGLLAFPLTKLTTGAAMHAQETEAHGHEDHGHEGEERVVKGGTDHPEGEHRHVEVPTLARLRYAHRPLSVSLKQGDEELLKGMDLSASPAELSTAIEISHEGNDLILTATWPEGTPDTALTMELEPDGFEIHRETRWSSGSSLDEVLTFTW